MALILNFLSPETSNLLCRLFHYVSPIALVLISPHTEEKFSVTQPAVSLAQRKGFWASVREQNCGEGETNENVEFQHELEQFIPFIQNSGNKNKK